VPAGVIAVTFIKKLLGWLVGIFAFFALLGFISLGVVLTIYWPTLPQVPDPEEYIKSLPGVTRIYGSRGELLAEIAEEYRDTIPYEKIPKQVIQALVAAEDQRFFEHHGVDYTGLARAVLTNLEQGQIVQGGSSLTQQLAKALLGNNERTFDRKIQDFLFALSIEKKLSKEQILTIYLNLVFFGEGAYGIQGAAKTFFSKDVSALSLAESALLVGLVKAPSSMSPMKVRNQKKALERRNFILRRMEALGSINAEQRALAEKEPLRLRPKQDPFLINSPYPTEKVRRELLELYGEPLVQRGGLRVETTLDLAAQRLAEEKVDSALRALDKRMGWRGPEAHLYSQKERGAFLDRASKQYGDTLVAGRPYFALVTRVQPNLAEVRVGRAEGLLPMSTMTWAAPYSALNFENGYTIGSITGTLSVGDVVQVKPLPRKTPEGILQFGLEQEPYIQGSIFSYELGSGYIQAYVAGRDYELSEFDRISQGCRQPGSTFKPIYYTLALQRGMSPETILTDRPKAEVDPITGEKWIPYNVDGTYLINCSMRTALVQSRNMPSIEVFSRMGAQDVARYSEHLGISTQMIADRALALGASCVKPFDMAKVFGVFASKGERIEPILLKRVLARDGSVLLDRTYYADPLIAASDRLDRLIIEATTKKEQVISQRTAHEISSLLRQVVGSGLAWHAQQIGAPSAGKTGTSSRTADLWYLGYTSQFMTEAWIGSDAYDRPLGADEQSSHVAVPLWTSYMKEFLAGRPQKEIPPPLPKSLMAQSPLIAPTSLPLKAITPSSKPTDITPTSALP
jgi:penicillin-binding protein 1A